MIEEMKKSAKKSPAHMSVPSKPEKKPSSSSKKDKQTEKDNKAKVMAKPSKK